jgi:drug/metabolite transporter (DMT)-like permease
MSTNQAATGASMSGLSPLVIACLLATWFVWGSTYLAIKFALVSFAPFMQMGTRFIAAGALLYGWMWWRGAPHPTPLQWRNALFIGALMLGGGMGGTAYSEQTIASGLIVAFIAVQPVYQAVLMAFWGVRPSKLEASGIFVGLIGVLLLVQGQGMAASPSGLIAVSLAVAFWGLGSVLSQRGFALAPGAMGFASEMLLGGVVLLVMSWVAGERWHWPPEPLALGAWFYLVVFGSLIAFNAYMVLLSKASAGLATSYSFVNPVIAMILGVTLGAEKITRWEWGCAGIVLVGVILIVWSAARKRRT